MKKLEVTAFVRFDLAVALQVTHMDEALRDTGKLIEVDGFRIESQGCPACFSDRLYVRGEYRGSDHEAVTIRFDTEAEKAEWIAKCKAAIRALNESEPEQPTGGAEVWS